MCVPVRQLLTHKSKQHRKKKSQALIKSDWVHLEICLYSRVVKRTDQRGQRCSCLFIAVLIFSQVWHLSAPIHPSLSLALFYHHILSVLPHGEVKHCDSAVFAGVCRCGQFQRAYTCRRESWPVWSQICKASLCIFKRLLGSCNVAASGSIFWTLNVIEAGNRCRAPETRKKSLLFLLIIYYTC